MALTITFFGLSITSSWGNGHATTYRGLTRELARRGHDVWFFERDVPWYAAHRDLPSPAQTTTVLYQDAGALDRLAGRRVGASDLVVVGSYVPDGIEVARWVLSEAGGVVAFYDIDTPVTLAALDRGRCEYLEAAQIPDFDLYLSFAGGPTLDRLERHFGARRARPLYCSVDPEQYYPEDAPVRWDLGYLGTYSPDRQPALERLLLDPAGRRPRKRFVVAGPQYPPDLRWPPNVSRIEHLPPAEHRAFYNAQGFTLNVTRTDMIRAGHSPSVRLFEAAACGVPIVSDWWAGLDTFFDPGTEILVARGPDEVVRILDGTDEGARKRMGARGRDRVLRQHTAAHRAAELEAHALEAASGAETAGRTGDQRVGRAAAGRS